MRFIFGVVFSLIFSLSIFAQSSEKLIAENFTATTLEGKSISLEELKGKIVILTFWSTRCPICDSEIPKYNQLAAKYAERDVVFLGLSMENEGMVENYTKRKTFNYILVPNSLGIIMQYAIKNKNGSFDIAYPTYFVINQKGEIEMKASGRGKTGAINSLIDKLLSSG